MNRQKAVCTHVHNEPIFFPVWLKYYSQFFEPRDIYVISCIRPKRVWFNDWLESEAAKEKFNILTFPDGSHFDETEAVNRVQAVQHQLLRLYDKVLCTDVDEILATTDGLGNYIDRFYGDFVRCTAYHLLHSYNDEPPIDLNRPIMQQRNWWIHDFEYDKPLLAMRPLTWIWGFHNCHQNPEWDKLTEFPGRPADPNLIMVHFRRMDIDICTNRAKARAVNSDIDEYHKIKIDGGDAQKWLDNFSLRFWFDGDLKKAERIPEYAKKFPI